MQGSVLNRVMGGKSWAERLRVYWWLPVALVVVGILVDAADVSRLWTAAAAWLGLSAVAYLEQDDKSAAGVAKALLTGLGLYLALLLVSLLLYLVALAVWALMGLVNFTGLTP